MNIGITRAGTAIVYKPHQDLASFKEEAESLSNSDRFDLYCMYPWLAIRSKRKYGGESDEYEWWVHRLRVITATLGPEEIQEEASKTNATNSYKMSQLGKKMVSHFWRER